MLKENAYELAALPPSLPPSLQPHQTQFCGTSDMSADIELQSSLIRLSSFGHLSDKNYPPDEPYLRATPTLLLWDECLSYETFFSRHWTQISTM